MADFSLLLEAERRGILPPEKVALLTEARRRGLVPDGGQSAPRLVEQRAQNPLTPEQQTTRAFMEAQAYRAPGSDPGTVQQQQDARRQTLERPVLQAFSEGFSAPRQFDPFGINPENQTPLSPLMTLPRAGLELAESLYSGGKQAVGQALYNNNVMPAMRETFGLPQRTGDTPERLSAQAMEMPELIANAMPIAPGVTGPQRLAAGLARRTDNVTPAARTAAGFGSQQAATQTARTAVGRGLGARAARRRLAGMATPDPNVSAAADRLGIDLPIDALSTDTRLRNLSGLLRSQTGSAAETSWARTTEAAVRRANEAFAQMGASPDVSRISADIRQTLNTSADTLRRNATSLRREVDETVNVSARVQSDNVRNWLQNRMDAFGGGAEGKAGLTADERALWELVSDRNPTYARLNQIRSDIGRDLERNSGPWMDALGRDLRTLYQHVSDDQLAHIATNYGDDLARKQTLANQAFTEMYGIRDRMQNLYGRDLTGSIAPILTNAITRGAKGDVTALNRIVKNIPEGDRVTALTSALFNAGTRSGAGQVLEGVSDTARPFSFAGFTSSYRGLRNNSEVYNVFSEALGPERMAVLDDLYAVSRRIADAETRISSTGKANQLALQTLTSQSFLAKVMQSSLQRTGGAVGAGIGAMFGGPVGAGAGATLGEAVQTTLRGLQGDNLTTLHNLLSSDEFRNLASDIAAGAPTAQSGNRLMATRTFRDYLEGIGVPAANGANWLRSVMSIEEAAEPQQQSSSGTTPQTYARVLNNMNQQGAPARSPNDYARLLSETGNR